MKCWFHVYRSHIHLTDSQKIFLSAFPNDESFNVFCSLVLGEDYLLKTYKLTIVDVCIKLCID